MCGMVGSKLGWVEAPIAEQILVAAAPGPMIADPSRFDWKRLQRGIRLKPNGPVF